ncbi:MAG: DNA internalization-related competence protein ComEC/Rec2 [Nitrospirae bacterium]|nr:DNA internalization-related competence protein ComEC/Rec2 [Nitrospirota bacterium]
MSFLLSFLSGIIFFFISRYFLFCSIVLFLSSAAWLIKNKKSRWIPFIVLGIVYALFRAPVAEQPLQPWNKKMEITGRFLQKGSAPSAAPDAQNFVIEKALDEETGQEIGAMEDEKIRLRADAAFDPDDTYELLVETGKDRTRLNPGSSGRVFLTARLLGILGQEEAETALGNMFERSRASLHEYIVGRFSKADADFISAVTIGEVHFDEDLKNAFNATGLAHILSISGTHFGLLSVVMFTLFLFLIRSLPYRVFLRLTLYLSPQQVAAMICLPLMVLYLGISGGSVPAVRSFVMISLFLFGLLIGRKGFWLNTVLLAAFALVLWDPAVIMTLTFQLSFIAVLFIGFSVERRGEDDEKTAETKKHNALAEFLKSSLRLTLAATIGTAPLVAYHFHYFSLISPFSNLVAAPLIGFVVLPLALISSFAYLLTGYYIFGPLVELTTDLSLWLVTTMAKIPFADIKISAFPLALVVFFYAGIFCYLAWGRKKILLLLPALPFLIYASISLFSPRELSVTFLDVGQGDAAVVELPDGKVLAVDTGRSGYETTNFLKYLGRRTVDALVITHSHPDHSGGADLMLKQYRIQEIWDNGRLEFPEELVLPETHRRLERGDIVGGRNYRIEVLHPYPEFYTREDNDFVDENNSSLVLKVTGRDHAFLFVGDVEDEAEDDLSHLGLRLKSDVLKVPHHGGRSSVHEKFLSEISPSIAVISVGRDNSFGHPRPEMLDVLSDAQIFRTDRDGAVKITETAGGLQISTYQDYALERADTWAKEVKNIRRLFSIW